MVSGTNLVNNTLLFLLHGGVPVIFDRVIGSALQGLGNDGPLVLQTVVLNKKSELFILAPVHLLDEGVQVVVPPLSALLSNATRNLLRNSCPLLSSVVHDSL